MTFITQNLNKSFDMKCLLTRSELQSQALAQKILEHGGACDIVPVMGIDPVELTGEERSFILDLDAFSTVIVVSANAARLLADVIDQYWPQLPIKLNWVAIGKATAKALSESVVDLSFDDIHVSEGTDSEALLNLNVFDDVADTKILLVKGRGGRTHIQTQLTAKRAKICELPLYERKALAENASRIKEALFSDPDYIQIASGDGFKYLLALLGSNITELELKQLSATWLVPSQRVAELLIEYGLCLSKIKVCQGASNDAFLAAMMDCERD